MPTHYQDDPRGESDERVPVVQFDPRLEVSPFTLFRRLAEGSAPLLVDVRPEPGPLTLAGAERHPEAGWEPPADRDVVLFDDDGAAAVARARDLQERGRPRVKALFGGLQLYEFSLDPQVVGEETYLERRAGE